MILPILALLFGLVVLVWAADRFVEGAANVARHFGVPSLLIGMVVVGFGTSAPEMTVSALASYEGNLGIALGNAYGSNICSIRWQSSASQARYIRLPPLRKFFPGT